MARLCIRIAPNDHPTDSTLTPMRTQEGDVVCLVDDSHVFSVAEMNNGQYKILDVPGVTQEELVHLVQHEEDGEGKITKRRTQALDTALLKNPTWRDRTSASKADVALLTKVKA